MKKEKFKIFGVGKKIKEAIAHAEIKKGDVAIKTKMSRDKLWRIMNGKKMPDSDDLQKIATATGKPLSYFVPNEQPTANIDPTILKALEDPDIREALEDPKVLKLIALLGKGKKETNAVVADLLEKIPELDLKKLRMILALSKPSFD